MRDSNTLEEQVYPHIEMALPDPWRPDLSTHRTQRIRHKRSGARNQRTHPVVAMPLQPEGNQFVTTTVSSSKVC